MVQAHAQRTSNLIPSSYIPPLPQPTPNVLFHQPQQPFPSSYPVYPNVVQPQQPPAIKLPPIRLPTFDGNPLQYHDWINTFNATVHNNPSITDTHRITYLQNSVTGKAKDLIKGYSYNPVFYTEALNDITKRFGDPDYIISSYITKLEQFPRAKHHDSNSLTNFTTFLKEFTRTFTTLNFTSDLTSSAVLRLAKEKLPDNLLFKWTEHAIRRALDKPSLVDFQEWLDVHAAVYDKMQMSLPSSSHTNSNKQPRTTSSLPTSTVQRNILTNTKLCPSCQQSHVITQCPTYISAEPKKRLQIVRDCNLCTNCLSVTHKRNDCASKNRCRTPDCGGFHHTSLHDPNLVKKTTKSSNTQQLTDQEAASPISPSDNLRLNHTSSQRSSRVLQQPASNSASKNSAQQNSRYGNSNRQINATASDVKPNAFQKTFLLNYSTYQCP